MTGDDVLAELLADVERAARAKLAAHTAVTKTTGARDRALAALVNHGHLSAPKASAAVRAHLLAAGLTEEEVALVGVSAETIGPAARTARALGGG